MRVTLALETRDLEYTLNKLVFVEVLNPRLSPSSLPQLVPS